jgi:hypothetical protein
MFDLMRKSETYHFLNSRFVFVRFDHVANIMANPNHGAT